MGGSLSPLSPSSSETSMWFRDQATWLVPPSDREASQLRDSVGIKPTSLIPKHPPLLTGNQILARIEDPRTGEKRDLIPPPSRTPTSSDPPPPIGFAFGGGDVCLPE